MINGELIMSKQKAPCNICHIRPRTNHGSHCAPCHEQWEKDMAPHFARLAAEANTQADREIEYLQSLTLEQRIERIEEHLGLGIPR